MLTTNTMPVEDEKIRHVIHHTAKRVLVTLDIMFCVSPQDRANSSAASVASMLSQHHYIFQ